MSVDERALLVALLRGPFQHRPMLLRQELVGGSLPSEVAVTSGSPLDIDDAARLIEQWERSGERMLTWLDDDYPPQLRDVRDFPPVVFVRGQLPREDRGVAVVGSRDVGSTALRAARDISAALVDRSLTVVAGLAAGIDTAAHQTALERGGRTVAVMGTGIDKCYPAANRQLKAAIERTGMTLSQFWPGAPGGRQTFPMRNAVMSAYSCATIIVTAGESSGTRHQARQAIAHGRPLVLSSQVATETTWGRKYAADDTALVSVAKGPEEAVDRALSLADQADSMLV